MQTTIRGKIFPSEDQAEKLDELMRMQSSAMRYSYNHLCENKTKSVIEADLKEKFSEINSRYRRGGYFRAKFNYESALELVKSGELASPEKVVFGGRENLKRRERGEISNEEWKRLRNNQLYSRGDKSKHGNLNLRLVEEDEELFLRVNVGDREWIHIPACLPNHASKFLDGKEPYGVRILREKGEYQLRVSFEENYETKIDFDKGAIGLDFNHDSIDLAVTNEQGQLRDTETIKCHDLTAAREGKRENLIGNYAKEVVNYAKHWQRGLVLGNLEDVARGRRNQHEFAHKKLLRALKRRAEKEGVAVREVNPAYTSVIGKHKYAPYYHITIHQAAALAVARRGQGLSEHLRGLKSMVFEPSEGGKGLEGAPDRRVHSWSLWRLMGDLGPRKGVERKYSDQSSLGVESQRTIAPTERSSATGDVVGAETVSPGSGPPAREATA